ncbi:MAG: HlyD family efflux transporter periplasmic adaptor subunit [Bdellovibrionaceae bacterium]|nr:HlyD family efflux transporter periplasmic adaptor subunit [Pseudobdellovibrionaceae bacterium]
MGNHRKIQSQKQFFQDNQISWAAIEAVSEGPSFVGQLGVLFLFLFAVSFFIYASKATVPVVIEGPGRVVASMPSVPLRSQSNFTVAQVNVRENEVVRRGQVLVTSKESLSPESMEILRAMIKGLQKINALPDASLCLNCRTLLQTLSQLYLGIKAQGEMLTLLSSINDQIRHLTSVIDSYNDIEKSVTTNRLQIKKAQRKLTDIRRRRAQTAMAKDVEDLEAMIFRESNSIEDRFRQGGALIKDVRRTLKARTKELVDRTEQIGKIYAVAAPIDGKVTNLKIKGTGELVTAGQEVMELIPSNSELIALVEVLNKDIANIKIGEDVIISIDSMPEMDFGTLKGKILDIVNVDPEESQRGGPLSTNFKIKVSLPQNSLAGVAGERPILLGMTLKGRIVTRFESLAKSLYRVLFRVKDNVKVKQ